MSVPLNRVVAFAGPYISIVAGGFATWLVAKANVLGIKGIDEANVATQASGALTFGLVSVLAWLGQSKWLTGHQLEMAADARVAAAAVAAPAPAPADIPADPEHEALLELGEDLPDDEVEFASQPPGLGPIAASAPDDDDLPDDDEEFANPPDPESRVTPDCPDLDDTVADEAEVDVDDPDEGDVRVAPQLVA